MHHGITCETLPPFRPDRKGLVEKMFDLMQNRYKPILRGKGIIEEDAQERWAVDYRAQASLDLTQFTAVLAQGTSDRAHAIVSAPLLPATG